MILMQAYCSGQMGYASGAIRRIACLTARIGDTTSFEASAAKSILRVPNINDIFVTGGLVSDQLCHGSGIDSSGYRGRTLSPAAKSGDYHAEAGTSLHYGPSAHRSRHALVFDSCCALLESILTRRTG